MNQTVLSNEYNFQSVKLPLADILKLSFDYNPKIWQILLENVIAQLVKCHDQDWKVMGLNQNDSIFFVISMFPKIQIQLNTINKLTFTNMHRVFGGSP